MFENDPRTKEIGAEVGRTPGALKSHVIDAMKHIFVQNEAGATVAIWDLLYGKHNAMRVHTAIVVIKLLIEGLTLDEARERAKELASLSNFHYFKKIQTCLDVIHAHISDDTTFPPLTMKVFVPRRNPNRHQQNVPLTPLSDTTRKFSKKNYIDDPAVVQEALDQAHDPSPDFGRGAGKYSPKPGDDDLADSIHTFDPVSVDQSRDYEAEAEETKADDAVAVVAPPVVAPPVVPPPSARVRGRARRHRPPTPPAGSTRRRRPDTPHPSPPGRCRRARRGATPPFLQSIRRLNFQVAALTRHFDGALAALGICQEEDGHETAESSESESEYDPDETLTDEDIKQEK